MAERTGFADEHELFHTGSLLAQHDAERAVPMDPDKQ